MGRKGRPLYSTNPDPPQHQTGLNARTVEELHDLGYEYDRRVGAWRVAKPKRAPRQPKQPPLKWFQRELRIKDPMTGREVTPEVILITYEANRKIQAACNHNGNLEVGGFGHTFLNDNGDVVVDDIYIPPQIVEGAHTNIVGPSENGADRFDAEGNRIAFGMEAAFLHFASRGESWSDWRLWWHSHVNMGVTPSGTDEATLDGIARQLDWAIGIVANIKGERHPWIVQSLPGHPIIRMHDFPIQLLPHPLPEAEAEIAAMMAHVERKVYTPPVNQYNRGGTPGAGFSAGNSNARKEQPAGKDATAAGGNSNVIHLPRPGKGDVLDLDDAGFAAWIADEGVMADATPSDGTGTSPLSTGTSPAVALLSAPDDE